MTGEHSYNSHDSALLSFLCLLFAWVPMKMIDEAGNLLLLFLKIVAALYVIVPPTAKYINLFNKKLKNKFMRDSIAKLLGVLVLFFTGVQGFVTIAPFQDAHTAVVVGAIFVYLGSACTIWQQFLSSKTDNVSIWPTAIVAVIATIAGVLDLLKVINIDPVTGQWIRFSVSVVTMLLGQISSVLWPKVITGLVVMFLLSFGLSSCSALSTIVNGNCKVQYNAPVSIDSTSYICLRCKNVAVLQALDSGKLLFKIKK